MWLDGCCLATLLAHAELFTTKHSEVVESSRTTKAKVLVIDDDGPFRAGIASLLNSHGYLAMATGSGEALASFRAMQPDVVITEIVMVEQEGLELILKLRQLKYGLTVIATTGGARACSYLRMACLLGAKASLHKPFTMDELLQVLFAWTAPTLLSRPD